MLDAVQRGLAIAGTVGLLGLGAFALISARRPRKAVQQAPHRNRRGVRSTRIKRSLLTVAAVVPGALLLGWTLAVGAFGMPIGLMFGWIPSAGATAAIGFMAYTTVELAPKGIRSHVALGVGVLLNLLYLLVLWRFIVSLDPE